jgi:Winged helix DNA-binding domain
VTTITPAQVRAFRLGRHGLETPASAGSMLETARALCGVHAQLASSAEIALSTRVADVDRGTVRDALEARTLVKTWTARYTLHVIPATDIPVYAAVLRDSWVPTDAWLHGAGITREQWDALLGAVPGLLGGGPKTREELADAVEAIAGKEVRGWVMSSWGGMLKLSAHRGELCFGPKRGQKVTFVRADEWVGELPSVSRDDAERNLARRFLSAYGPSRQRGIAYWIGAGQRMTKAKRLLAAVDDETTDVNVDGKAATILSTDEAALRGAEPSTTVRLLPTFDPYVVGFQPRRYLVDPEFESRVFRPQGWISAVVLVGGLVVGTWKPDRGRVEVDFFRRTGRPPRGQLAEEIDRIRTLLA